MTCNISFKEENEDIRLSYSDASRELVMKRSLKHTQKMVIFLHNYYMPWILLKYNIFFKMKPSCTIGQKV